MKCPYCQKDHQDTARFCPETGKMLGEVSSLEAGAAVKCPHCMAQIPKDAGFCPKCGKAIAVTSSNDGHVQKLNKKTLAGIFSVSVVFIAVGLAGLINDRLPGKSTPGSIPNISDNSVATVAPKLPDALSSPASEPTEAVLVTASSTPLPTVPSNDPNGKIVYTCQIFKNNNRNQICIMKADGTDQRRMTTNDRANHWYASLAPDGMSVVFSSNQTGDHEIYEMDLDGNQVRLTTMGELYAPEISPDGQLIAFTNAGAIYSSIWIMDRDGRNPHEIYSVIGEDALDPTWSPDGEKILFAQGQGNNKKLYIVNRDGSGLKILNDIFTTRGRSDWSENGRLIAGYTGGSWEREIFIMNSDGSNLKELFSSGNAQAPSFSPNDKWITFTGYLDNMGNEDGCEIYIIGTDGNGLQRLTENEFCDWQPRWGP